MRILGAIYQKKAKNTLKVDIIRCNVIFRHIFLTFLTKISTNRMKILCFEISRIKFVLKNTMKTQKTTLNELVLSL